MDLRRALKQQYLGALAMLRQAIERCPDDLWVGGTFPRNTWRIAYHAVFYSHLYLVQNEAAFQRWDKHREGSTDLWDDEHEPPVEMEPYSKGEVLSYLDQVVAMVPGVVGGLDLDAAETGFDWYPEMSKISHEIMSLRHIQGHVGQLSELLMARGVDIDWISGRTLA